MAALPDDTIAIRTDLFEHSEVRPHFINDCCFGEDFAQWLRHALAHLTAAGFGFSDPVQEDYGWGLHARHGGDTFRIALSYGHDGPIAGPAEWIVSVNRDDGLNILRKLWRRSDATVLSVLRGAVRDALGTNPGIEILTAVHG
jgi:hypothetical protein